MLALFWIGIFSFDTSVLGDVVAILEAGNRDGSLETFDGEEGTDGTTGTNSFVGSSLTNVPWRAGISVDVLVFSVDDDDDDDVANGRVDVTSLDLSAFIFLVRFDLLIMTCVFETTV